MLRIAAAGLLLTWPLTVLAEPETITVSPRIFADYDLSEYRTTATAKTATLQRETGKQRAYLGLHVAAHGNTLRVMEVDIQSPAARAGIRAGDVVSRVEGQPLTNPTALRDLLLTRAPGETISLTITRAGKSEEYKIKLQVISAPMTASGNSGRPTLGIQTSPSDKGPKITEVVTRSAASRAELMVGDVILSVNDKRITTPETLSTALAGRNPGDTIILRILRDGKEISKTLTLGTSGGRGNPGGGRGWDTRQTGIFRKPLYRLAVLTLSFPDVAINEKIPLKAWEDSLFSKGTYNTTSFTGQTVYGSLRDYYQEISCGMLDITGKVFAPVKLTKKRQEYANSTTRTAMFSEAIDLLRDRDGKDSLKDFDGLFFLYADETATQQRGGLFWPHRSSFSHKGERWSYFICPEGGTRMNNISTIAHEFGHMLGLPDLYAKPEVPGSEGVGSWCAMSQQLRNGRPQHFGAWSKEQMGWIKPVVIDPSVPQKLILSPIEGTTSECFKVLVKPDGSEYFLLENRKKTGFDTDLPGEGLLIWRVVDGRPILEEAHGVTGLEGPRVFPTSVPYPSKANHSFTPDTTPSSQSMKQGGKEVHITNIRRLPDGRITFQIGYQYF